MAATVKQRRFIYQCKSCRYILTDSIQANDDNSERESPIVKVKGTTHHVRVRRQGQDPNFLLQCGGCPGIVGSCDSRRAGVYQLQREQVIRSYISSETVEQLELKVNQQEVRLVEQEAKLVEQEAKIVELGIQAIQNRFDIIHLQHIITKIHPDPQIKEELEKGIGPEILGLRNPQ